MPGRFRETQNWIGAEGAGIAEATFVPPPVARMTESLANLESFFHDDAHPPLIACALAHAQFETIHPFLDGNGRVGRLLITFQLVNAGVLHRPLLYLSHYLKRRRAEYYDRLMAVREDGNWEAWTTFFLRGVAETAEEATETAEKIVKLQEDHRALIQNAGLGMSGMRMLDLLFQRPLFNVNLVRDTLDVAYNTARRVIDQAVSLGIVEEVTGAQRFRVFRYTPYWRLLEESQPAGERDTPPQITESTQ
jgi:Fic family protein